MSIHTVFCAECTSYFDWKSAGMFYSHKMSGALCLLSLL